MERGSASTINRASDVASARLAVVRRNPAENGGRIWLDHFYFGEGIGYRDAPTMRVAFDGGDVRVDDLGNFEIYRSGPWQAFFPSAMFAGNARALQFYSDMGPRHRLTPARPALRISRATRLRPTRVASAARSAWMRGAPQVPWDRVLDPLPQHGIDLKARAPRPTPEVRDAARVDPNRAGRVSTSAQMSAVVADQRLQHAVRQSGIEGTMVHDKLPSSRNDLENLPKMMRSRALTHRRCLGHRPPLGDAPEAGATHDRLMHAPCSRCAAVSTPSLSRSAPNHALLSRDMASWAV